MAFPSLFRDSPPPPRASHHDGDDEEEDCCGDGDVRGIAEAFVDRLLAARDWSRPEDPHAADPVDAAGSSPSLKRRRQSRDGRMPRDLRVLGGRADCVKIIAVLLESRDLLLTEPSLLCVDPHSADEAPLRIVGDIHAQFGDLLRILFDLRRHAAFAATTTTAANPAKGGSRVDGTAAVPDDPDDPSVTAAWGDEGLPPATRYVFLGGYVNRGRNGIECVVLLLCLKLLFPKHVYLLRGSDECAGMTRSYGFYDEVKRRFDVELWKRFTDVFNCLPIAALVAGRILCVHGGVSPELVSLDQIADIRRPTDVPDSGLLCDLLWADPDPDEPEWSANGRCHALDFGIEAFRGVASKVGFEMLVRSHQVVERGYEFPFPGSREVVTLFSAPNYCDEFDNDGAVMLVGAAASTTTSAPPGDITCAFMVLPRLHDGGDTSWRARARNV